MPVSTSYAPLTYAGNGSTVALPVTFEFHQPSHLVVTRINADASETVLTLGTDYTVSQSAIGAAGTVTLVTAAVAGTSTRIDRRTPKTQPDTLQNQGLLTASALERIVNRTTMQMQELDARVPEFDLEPLAPLVVSADGTRIESGSTIGTGDMLLRGDIASPDAGKGAALVKVPGSEQNLAQVEAERIRITKYQTSIAVGWLSALQLAYDACPEGGVIEFPQGQSYNLVGGGLTVSKSVTFKGEGRDVPAITCDGSFSPFTVAAGTNGVIFDGLQILASGAPKTAGTAGIKAVATSLVAGIGYLEVRNCNINGFEFGMWGEFCQFLQVSNSRLWANKYGYYTRRCVNSTIDQTIMESNTLWGCFIDGDSGAVSESCGTLLSLCDIVGNGSAGGGTDGGNFLIQYNEHFSLENCMIDVPSVGSKFNVRAIGVSRGNIGGGSWIGASRGSGIYFTGCDSITIGHCNVLSSLGYGIELETTSNCVINGPICESNGAEDIIIYGAAGVGTNNVIAAARLKSTAVAQSISEVNAHYTTVSPAVRCSGTVVLDAGSFHGKRMYTAVGSITLAGGAPTEAVNLPLPAGFFAAKPDFIGFTGVSFPVACAYKHSDALTTATNALCTLTTIDGLNIPAGAYTYSLIAYGR